MNFKLIRKIAGALGYKLFDKNYVKNNRLCGKYSDLNIKNILKSFFDKKIINSLIQIGANDGKSFDDLSFFIKKYQTNSILVEPIPEHFDELKINYSQLKNVNLENVAISEDKEKKYLYSVKKKFRDIYGGHAKAISSFNLDHLLKHGVRKGHIEKLFVNSLSVEKLFEKYKLTNIDLFYVDAEGYDGEIVLSFLKNSFECKIIIFEYIHIKNNLLEKLLEELKVKKFRIFPINENLVCMKNNIEFTI
tara:strand:+ start:7635 stop:8378 length:744 start_codon:yes stop_codon:yes gene_type:complete